MLHRITSALTLQDLDAPWNEMVGSSLLVRLGAAAGGLVPHAGTLGDWLQKVSYVLALILYAALAAPQFANDKNGLALIAMAGFALWLLGYLMGGKERRSANFMDALVLAYFGFNVVATASSHYFSDSLRGLAKVAVYVISYYYLTSILNAQPKRRAGLIFVLSLVAALVTLYGFYQYKIGVEPLATWEDPTVETKGTRIFGTLGNPNLLAGYLLPVISLSASLGLAAASVKRWALAIPFICIAIMIAIGTLLTGSRGGYLGLFATILSLIGIVAAKIWLERPKLRLPIIMALLVGAIGIVLALHLVPAFEQRLTSIFAGREHSSNAFRMNVWQSSFRMFKDNWWLGIGVGKDAFCLAYGLYMTSGFDALGTYCVPLEVAVETGVLGLGCFTLLIVCLLSRAHRSFWSDPGWERWISAGAAAALIGMMVHGLVDTVFYRPQVHFIFWLLVALLATVPLNFSDET